LPILQPTKFELVLNLKTVSYCCLAAQPPFVSAAHTVAAGPFFDTRRDRLVALAAPVPTMYHFREFPAAGGLMSYGIDNRVTYRQIGVYGRRAETSRQRRSQSWWLNGAS
jgi:hypothetical protein